MFATAAAMPSTTRAPTSSCFPNGLVLKASVRTMRRAFTSTRIGAVIPPGSLETFQAALAPRPMPPKNLSLNSRLPSSLPHSQSPENSGMLRTSRTGSNCLSATTKRSSLRQALRPKLQITCNNSGGQMNGSANIKRQKIGPKTPTLSPCTHAGFTIVNSSSTHSNSIAGAFSTMRRSSRASALAPS